LGRATFGKHRAEHRWSARWRVVWELARSGERATHRATESCATHANRPSTNRSRESGTNRSRESGTNRANHAANHAVESLADRRERRPQRWITTSVNTACDARSVDIRGLPREWIGWDPQPRCTRPGRLDELWIGGRTHFAYQPVRRQITCAAGSAG
jgi:hypothetical protein